MEAVLLAAALALGYGAVTVGKRAEPAPELTLTRPSSLPTSVPLGSDAVDIRSFDALVMHPGHAVTPPAILLAFRQAEAGDPRAQCDLIEDLVEGDSHLRNLFEQREQAVAGKPWVMQADGADGDSELAARILGDALRRLPTIEIFQHLLSFNRYGWACAEIDWGITTIDGAPWIVPTWIAPVPARRFAISTMMDSTGGVDELRLITDLRRLRGDALRTAKWLVVRRPGPWLARSGLMRTAAWPAMAKRFGFRDWLVYSQRFGLPLPIVEYPKDADDNEISVAKQIVKQIGSDAGAAVREGMKLEFHDATRGNQENSKAHGGLIAHCNREMSKLVNGATLTNDNSDSGGASYALGEVHDTVRWEAVSFDAERLQETVRNQLAAPFMVFNNLRGMPPLLKVQVVRNLEPKVRSEIAARLKNELGIDVSVAQMRQELGFREPTGDGDKAPGMPEPPPAGGIEA